MSREHYVSRGVFPVECVTVIGHSPLPESMRTIHIDELVAKTLCQKHNNALSDLDQALIDLVNCIRETERLREVRKGIKSAWYAPVRLTVDGTRIERSVLKMVLNYAVVLHEHLGGWRPPDWLPEVVFGTRPLVEGSGLAMISRVGDQIVSSESIRFAFGMSDRDGEPFSAMLELRQGWRLLCSWVRPLSDLGGEFHLDSNVYLQENLISHPKLINFEHEGRNLGISLEFDWSGRWSPKKFHNVAKLRGKYRAPLRKGK